MPTFSVCGFTDAEFAEKKHLDMRRQLSFCVGKDALDHARQAASEAIAPDALKNLALWEAQTSQVDYLKLRFGNHAYYLLLNPATESYLRQKSISYRHLGYVQAASEEPKGCIAIFRSHAEAVLPTPVP